MSHTDLDRLRNERWHKGHEAAEAWARKVVESRLATNQSNVRNEAPGGIRGNRKRSTEIRPPNDL